ncbi:hypothetical protein [Streptomyces sp. NPDC058330]|uniref:hypothetical protein n=1 Tax=Streptomyces sp. NPDC058330 TaxID=3346449 RepID=UPI0036F09C19
MSCPGRIRGGPVAASRPVRCAPHGTAASGRGTPTLAAERGHAHDGSPPDHRSEDHPVAFRDPALLNAVGVHEPFALRAVVEVTTGDGLTGLGLVSRVPGLATIWDRLPDGHGRPLVGPYTAAFLGAYAVVKLFEYNGGMWNLAQRYMTTDSPKAARRSAALSALLYVEWPAVLLFPPVAAAVLLPDIADPAS